MFISPDRILEAYGDYRESIGRPRVNSMEDMKESIPYAHFVAGVNFAIQACSEEGFFLDENEEDLKEEDAEDAL